MCLKVCVYFACLRTAEEQGAVHPVAPAPDIHEGRDVQQVTPPLTDTRTWRAISGSAGCRERKQQEEVRNISGWCWSLSPRGRRHLKYKDTASNA